MQAKIFKGLQKQEWSASCLLSLSFTFLSDSFQKTPIFLINRNKLMWKTPKCLENNLQLFSVGQNCWQEGLQLKLDVSSQNQEKFNIVKWRWKQLTSRKKMDLTHVIGIVDDEINYCVLLKSRYDDENIFWKQVDPQKSLAVINIRQVSEEYHQTAHTGFASLVI